MRIRTENFWKKSLFDTKKDASSKTPARPVANNCLEMSLLIFASACRRLFSTSFARFSTANAANDPVFLQHGVVAGTAAAKLPVFNKQQPDTEQKESGEYQQYRNDQNRQHKSKFCDKVKQSYKIRNVCIMFG
jgi:hypothetical protein